MWKGCATLFSVTSCVFPAVFKRKTLQRWRGERVDGWESFVLRSYHCAAVPIAHKRRRQVRMEQKQTMQL